MNRVFKARRLRVPIYAVDRDRGKCPTAWAWTFDRIDGMEVDYEGEGEARVVAEVRLDRGPVGHLIAPAGCFLRREAGGERYLYFPNGDRLSATEAWLAAHSPTGRAGWHLQAVRPDADPPAPPRRGMAG